MSCSMVLNIEASIQLTRQLNQLFSAKQEPKLQVEQQNEASNPNVSLNTSISDNEGGAAGNQRGFKFPWFS